MFRTTRTVTSRIISCIIIAGLLVAYYIPYYPSMADRWIVSDANANHSSFTLPASTYRLVRPTSRFTLCDDRTCDAPKSIFADFSGGILRNSQGQEKMNIRLSLTGYGEIGFSGLSLSEQGRHMSMISPSWSGNVFVPGHILTGDGVISFVSSGYIDVRWLGESSSLFKNPYHKVIIDRRFISQ